MLIPWFEDVTFRDFSMTQIVTTKVTSVIQVIARLAAFVIPMRLSANLTRLLFRVL